FQHVRRLDARQFQQRMQRVDEADEIRALASQIHALSGRVARKHLYVNLGFVFAAASLILFLAAGLSYVATLAA
ncbi:MAG: hypothetical protein JO040_07415, partial [Gemmatimonadetes bacterium]|nr:hypothetical protein [Gemmatimonadota bacterium]